MKRFIVFKNSTSHGTILFCEREGVYITSQPLDDAMGTAYWVSHTGLLRDAQLIVQKSEVVVPAPGIAAGSIAPFAYRIELGEQARGEG